MSEVTIRRAKQDDLERILETLRAALGETPTLQRTPDLWNWKHVVNPFGESIVYVAEINDRIAGVRALMKWKLLTPEGDTVSCARPVDTATHPDYLRRGIFRDLTMTAVDAARSQGVQLVFNTPNAKSTPGYLKMGWQEVARIGVLARIRLGRVMSPPRTSPPLIADLAPEMKPLTGSPIATIDRAPGGLRTPRSDEYLAWRFSSHPKASYGYLEDSDGSGLVARASERSGRSELVVSDLLATPAPEVIRRAARLARSQYLAGWFSPGSPERRAAVLGGMIPIPILRTLRLVALPLADLDLDVFDLSSWDLATSDLELL